MSEHDGGPDHPEQPSRLFAVMDGVRDLGLGDEIVYPAVTPKRRRRAGPGALAPPTWPSWRHSVPRGRRHRPGHLRPAGLVERPPGVPPAPGWRRWPSWIDRGEGVAFVPVRPPGHHADARPGHGVLPRQQRGGGGGVTHGEGRAGADRRLGRPSRQRDPGDLLGRPRRPLRLDPPAPAVPGDGTPGRGRRSRRARAHGQRAAARPGRRGTWCAPPSTRWRGPTIEEFRPDWVLVSCGFDAHRADPLGELALSSGDFAELARVVSEFAPRPGRLALFLEGGYDPARSSPRSRRRSVRC